MNRLTRWFPLVIISAGVLAYANSFSAPFVLDDARVITGNPNIHTLWPPWKAVYVPSRWVADLTFAVNLAISGFTPSDFRMTNILIHITSGLILYALLLRTLRLPRLNANFGQHAEYLALAAALLWTVHPLQTNGVTYVAQRIEALMGLFYLATFYCFARSLGSPHPRRWSNAALTLCALGMGTKEVMVTAPVLLLFYDVLLSSSSWLETLRRRWTIHLAFFLSIGIFALLFLMGVGLAAGQNVTLLGNMVSPWHYLLTQTEVILHYLRLSFLPTSLCLFYRWPIAKGLATVWPAACAITALGIITLHGTIRRKVYAFPLLWFFIILAPTSSILPLPDAAFEHRMYLPLAGVVSLILFGAYSLCKRGTGIHQSHARHVFLLMLVVMSIALWFASLTYLRNTDYQSDETIWRDVATKRPENYRSQLALSGMWIGRNRNQEAIILLTNMLARLPDYSQQPFEVIQSQWKADPSIPCVDYALARSLLGTALFNLGETNVAASHFREAMRITPSHPTPYLSMARIAIAQQRYQEAVMWVRKAYQRSPDDQNILGVLASLYAIQRNWQQAIKFYGDILRLNPTHSFARAQLAWILATCPNPDLRNGPQAINLAIPLIAMSGEASPRAFDILAAAYAESGKFDAAIHYAGKAIPLLDKKIGNNLLVEKPTPGHLDPEISKESILNRIGLYKQGKPYHTSP